ncbi:RidA family protein [Oscillospiraceae bacterium OttesenSCG-928-G22]|nr:RidA family protein [Oscillospiraceae bacterium OttesenSCG-928-G22]
MNREVISTEKAPAAIGPYVQATKAGEFIYTSGQLGIDMAGGGLAVGVEAQTHAAMKNLGAILNEGGAGYGNILKTTIFLQNLDDFAVVNKIYESYFDGTFPARSCVQVAKLPLGGLVEIECVAIL